MRVQRFTSGVLEIGASGYDCRGFAAGASWHRIDRWVPASGKTADGAVFALERCFVVGRDDDSDRFHETWANEPGNGRYDGRCSCCWLGFTHSVRFHARALTEAGDRTVVAAGTVR